jgi:hypothetical protein
MRRRDGRHEIPEAVHAAKRYAVERILAAAPPAHPRGSRTISADPRRNLVGIGIGRKFVKGRRTSRPAVHFYVARKLDPRVVPSHYLLPDRIAGVETDVVETGPLAAQILSARQRRRPAQPGCSIGFLLPPPQDDLFMAGTLGAVVTRGTDRFILSNNHVLAHENSLPIGTAIIQPGALDQGKAATDAIATLSQFVPLTADGPNRFDCALAEVTDGQLILGRPMAKVGKLSSELPIDAVEGMRVEKVGRGSGYTVGAVFGVHATIALQYDLGLLTFEDQLVIRAASGTFSEYGDSGALVVDVESGQATGLLIGGNGDFSVANHLTDVLTELGVTLVV